MACTDTMGSIVLGRSVAGWSGWRHVLIFVQPDTVVRWQRAPRGAHFNVTEHPTSAWVAQQMVEAFADRETPHYLIRDRDGVYGNAGTGNV
jgi:hypothetical protein